jgi:uncharacterized protein (TIGR02996 family)
MNEEAAFIRAICEQPDEDTPRLAFADWLDEHDRPERAEFIRVQCERARGLGDRERRTQLLKRSMQLVQQYGAEWYVRDWPDAAAHAVTGYSFDRGFADTVSLSRCRLRGADIVRIGQTRPLLSLVRVLNLSMNEINDGGVRAIADCRRLGRLRHLILSRNPVTLRGIEWLAASPHLTSLTEVTLNYLIDPNDAILMANVLAAHNTAQEAEEIFRRHGKAVRVRT